MATDRDAIESAPTMPQSPVLAPSEDLIAGVIAERYEVLGLLGVGGMGRVYRVRDRSLDETVALKVLRHELVSEPRALDRFLQEVKLARRVTSPHVVRTFDLGQHGADHFLTMEYLEGRSLAQLLDDGPLAIGEALRIAKAATEGIAAAHAAGVLHRDLKPDNVLVANSGRIAITDFGIARPTQNNAGATGDGLVGTPAYMAPEQVRGAPELGPQADVYAFGAMLYEMLTGKRVFPGDDALVVALARLHQDPPDPRALRPLPESLAQLVLTCLAREPAERYRDGSALAGALAALDVGLSETQRPPPMPAPAAMPAKTARSVAVLPLRSPPDLVDVAEGLSEELIDALCMTRGLRVRPLASVRRAASPGLDPRELGKALGVDVVVEGSVRRMAGALLRVSARVIGVADGFQLWANRADAPVEALLSVSDELAKAIAIALATELDSPVRQVGASARATELYLEAKHKLRAEWGTAVGVALPLLEEAHRLAPDDPSILAAYSLLLSRLAFFGVESGDLAAARAHAERAVGLAPGSGEAWLARGVADLYAGAIPDAAFALGRAALHAPGLAMAQWALGGVLLEAGALDEGLAHLEAALAIDPSEPQVMWDVARVHALAGRYDEAFARLDRIPAWAPMWRQVFTRARFRAWRGEASPGLVFDAAGARVPASIVRFNTLALPAYGTRTLSDEAVAVMLGSAQDLENKRHRAVRCQFAVEVFSFSGREDAAAEALTIAVEAGLEDLPWMESCPLLAPLRARPSFAPLHAEVAARAAAVLAAVRAARASTTTATPSW